MILLDTNVLSEVMRPAPASVVAEWLSRQDRYDLFTTTVTEAEVFAGIEIVAPGKRQTDLRTAAEAIFERFEGRVLPFDRVAAREYGRIIASRRKQGRLVSELDAQIAAIALCHQSLLATRNVRDFEGCGVRLVNPWEA